MKNVIAASLTALIATLTSSAYAATLVASYDFNNSLAANQSNAPTLTAINPLDKNSFETALVNGQNQTVYHWIGNGASSNQNAGLSIDTTDLITYNSYSIAMTFEFSSTAQFGGGWRRIIDTETRQSDNGFYVSPDNHLEMVQSSNGASTPFKEGSTLFTTPGFHNVVLTVSPSGSQQQVSVYFDSKLEFTTVTNTFNLDNASNTDNLLYFFVDNTAAGAQQEYADGRIASLKIYDGAFIPSAVPEPQNLALLLSGLIAISIVRRRHMR